MIGENFRHEALYLSTRLGASDDGNETILACWCGVGGSLWVKARLPNEFTKTYILTTCKQFGFDAHGYTCVKSNKSLRKYLTQLHFYKFFVFDRYICGLYSVLLEDIMNIDSFENIHSSRNKLIIYCAETRNIVSKFCLSRTYLF